MQTLVSDVRFALRQFLKNPGFTSTAVISLALGIGATTAVFSVVYAALLNPFPYRAVDRIVRLSVRNQSGTMEMINLNGPQVRELQKVGVVESVLAMDFHPFTLTGQDLPANVTAVDLIGSGFDDLGDPPILGRGLKPSDAGDGQDPEPVVVLGYKFWRKQFLGDPAIVGKKLQLDHKSYTIVGVAAPRFIWYTADLYRPLKLMQGPDVMYVVDFRLRAGVSNAQANSALEPLLRQFARDFPKRYQERFKIQVEGLNQWVVRSISGTLFLLLGAVGLLLGIGCGNVSILLLARGAARQHELALRVAIGAHRRRIVRQLLTESLLLSMFGVALGVAMSYGILAGIQAVLPRYAFAPEVVVRINFPVMLFSAAVALATGIIFGLWPALQLSRAEGGQMIHPSARRVAGSVHGRRTHAALIAGQIALTLLLLAGAGSAMQAFAQMVHTPLGYDPHNVLSLGIPIHDNSYTTWAARSAYFEQLRAKVAETPGVSMAAVSNNANPPRSGTWARFEIAGSAVMEQPKASIALVDPNYFVALRIPLLGGRIWSDTENRNGAHVAVINQTLARRYFPNGDAIGRSVRLPAFEERPPAVLSIPQLAESWLQIVGIAGDVRNDGISKPVAPAIFVPYTLRMNMYTQLLVRTAGPPLALTNALRAQLAAVNPEQQVYGNVEDLETWISDMPEWQQEHLVAWIFGVFAGLALILAAVGLYSVVSYTVAQRTSEFGIRMALGAQRGHVLRIVFAFTAVSVAAGIVAGLALTVAMNKILGHWVKANSLDPVIVLAGAFLMGAVATAACAIPAWRASAADPVTALRSD